MRRTIRLCNREVPRLGLGTNRLSNAPANIHFIRTAVDAGIGMIDTAHLYTGGDSERTIGRALSGVSHTCIVATKGGFHGAEPETLRAEIAHSLPSLGVETIDLYYLHRVDKSVPIETSVAVIKEFQDAGKIAHIGLSEVDVAQIERARQVAPIAAVQNHYNLSERKYDSVVDYCAEQQLVFVPFFPLKGESPYVAEVAARKNCSAAQVVLAWLLMRSPVMFPIPGTLSLDHLRDNVAALEIELSQSEFDAIAQSPAASVS